MKSKTPHKKSKRRVGRGNGSGSGKTSARGHKGQKSRSGSSARPGFEGGQMTFIRRLPKRGFSNARFAKLVGAVNVSGLNRVSEDVITPELMVKAGLLNGQFDAVKVLGSGKLEKKITVHAHLFSASAIKKIEEAGGTVVIIEA